MRLFCSRFIVSDASFLRFDTWHRSSVLAEGLGFLCPSCFFFLRYVIELPTLHFGGRLYCMWADLKRSGRVSPVELRAAFIHVNFVHMQTFNH